MDDWPFLGTEAIASGVVTKRTLRSRYEMVYRNVDVPRGVEITPADRAMAAWLWSGRGATVAGLSAAALFGTRWLDPHAPAELIRADTATNGIVVHRDRLLDDELCWVRGIPVTTPARTSYDLGRRPGLSKAVIRLDALGNATGLRAADIEAVARRHPGSRGVVQLRHALQLMDAVAESPQESRTRLLLMDGGLQRHQTQIVVRNSTGRFVARVDMGWEEWKVGVEFDGAQHRTDPAQRTRDIDRYAELADRGWVIVRVNSELLRYRPAVVLERVRAALRAAQCGLQARSSRSRSVA
jgi:very-short-patch-repair endonuclease